MSLNRAIVLLVLSVFGLSLALNASSESTIIRLSDRQLIAFSQMMADVEKAKIVLIGESHDNKRHHDIQLEVIRALHAKKVPMAIGLEMFQTVSQRQLDDWVAGKFTEEEFQRIYQQNWSIEWPMYREIFLFARDNHIPLIALNIPMEIMTKVARYGFASLSSHDKKDLPPEVSCELNTDYTAFLKKSYTEIQSHAMNESQFLYFCEAQSLRNNGMAWHVSRYLKQHPAETVVILTGILHAVKTGIPNHLEQYGLASFRVVLPELPEFESRDALAKETDYLYGM